MWEDSGLKGWEWYRRRFLIDRTSLVRSDDIRIVEERLFFLGMKERKEQVLICVL